MKYKILLLITVISAAVYANSINNGFVYDDRTSVIENVYIRDIRNIPLSFTHPEYLTSAGFKNHYRPLVVVSHTLDYAIDGLNPAVFRITNLLFHIGTAFLLFLTVEAILGSSKKFIALAAALVFAVHPFNSEAVNYIVARSSLMSGFFYLLAFYCWVRFREEETDVSRLTSYVYLASILAFLLGMLSKEVVITLPIVLWLYDIYFIHPLRTPHSAFRTLLNWRTYIPYLPFIVLIAIPLIVRYIHADGGVIPPFKRDILSQVFTIIPVLAGYLKLMFFPAGLTIAHYVETQYTILALPLIISILVLLCYAINAVYLYTRKEVEWRLLSFFMLWYFVTLLIILIVPLNRVMQENRSYISGAGFAIFIGIVIWKLVYSRQRPGLAYGLLVFLLVLYSAGTVYRNTAWKDSITIWTDAMEKSALDPLIYNNLSVAYKDIKNYDKAKEILYRGIRLFPNDRFLHYTLGTACKVTGDLESALSEFDRAMKIAPHAASAYTGKGSVYLLRGEINGAIGLFRQAIERNQEYAPAHYYMARALQMSGQLMEAERELDIALYYANMSHDRNLAERIKRYIMDDTIRSGVIEDLSIQNEKGDT